MENKRNPAFPNGSNIRMNIISSTALSYWEKLKAIVDYEPMESITPEVRGIFATIGFIKGVR